jgi:sortase A
MRGKNRKTTMRSFLIAIAVMIAAAAAALFVYNAWESEHGEGEAERALAVLKPEIKKYSHLREKAFVIGAPEIEGMPVIRIDGIEYIGEIRIPDLGMDLPVRAAVDYSKLKESPCRYSGSYIDDSLVVCAHDYSKRFSKLSGLDDGSEIFFTNANGEVYRYVIRSHTKVNDEDIGKLTGDAGEDAFDLALVTCNMGGQAGYAAWCVRAEDD